MNVRVAIHKDGYAIVEGIHGENKVIVDKLTLEEVKDICAKSRTRWAKNALYFITNLEYYTNHRRKYT